MLAQERARGVSPATEKRLKQHETNAKFTLKDFMREIPKPKKPVPAGKETPLPSTVLLPRELQDLAEGWGVGQVSTFNLIIPTELPGDSPQGTTSPHEWVKTQYSHCVIPELGEQYDFTADSQTFFCLRDIHNGRVTLRNRQSPSDDQVFNIASRWIRLEEKDRPASDGYLANGDIFIATSLPLTEDKTVLEQYIEENKHEQLDPSHYIPRCKYSVHFVGKPRSREDATMAGRVNVGSVLVRNTSTGDVIFLDTGGRTTRSGRAAQAGDALRTWLDFQRQEHPDTDFGPISEEDPLIIDIDKETRPAFRSVHALVSATLLLRRRITNWGHVKEFRAGGVAKSELMAKEALRNISGWLGLESKAMGGEQIKNKPSNPKSSFVLYSYQKSLGGRGRPLPMSQRIASAKQGEAAVYVAGKDDSSDDGSDSIQASVSSSQKTVRFSEDIADEEEAADSEVVSSDEGTTDGEKKDDQDDDQT
ncbi:hypothetical protein Daus18300_010589 [Diaporthe australafricana]|uniref:Uncharacterized protein n=1 Tax=Diaporthe australafricana TaxID=127596 RepID=A0ABR3WAD2_9PEZI